MSADQEYIALYRTLVQRKFLLGAEDGKLKQRDLEYVANLIEEKSKVRLSVSTLKRLWRNDLNQLPHPSTLDALVSILDCRDWQDFKKLNDQPDPIADRTFGVPPRTSSRILPALISFAVLILVVVFFVIQGFNNKGKVVKISKPVHFTADKMVTYGVPNTVIFHYDLSGVEADSFFIQQSWNPRDKVLIDPAKNYYSAIYYTPGFHFARIIANDSILKFQKVHIKTDGWFPIIKYDMRDKKYIELDKRAIRSNGFMHAATGLLQRSNVDIGKDFFLRYYNIRDFEGITSNNFDFETRVKSDSVLVEGRATKIACPLFEIMLVTEENVFYVPLSSKGCVGELDLLIGDIYKSGKDNDLSKLGTNLYDWQSFRIRNEKKKVSIFLNGTLAHEMQYQKDFGNIKGIIYTFAGAGSVDFIRLKKLNGDIVYADDFN